MHQQSIKPDPKRDAAAALLAEGAHTWARLTLKRPHGAFPVGTVFYLVPSSRPGVSYRTNAVACDCPDYQQRDVICKHVRSIRLFESRQQQTEAGPSQEDGPTPAPLADQDAESILLARLLAEQSEHGKRLKLLGYERSEYTDDPIYAQRAHHIERLQARRVASVAPFALAVAE